MIKTSEKTDQIIKKIYEIQAELTGVEKNSTNPFFKSSYPDLNTILDHLFPILQEKGLIINQSSLQRESYLDTSTRLTDIASSQYFENSVSVPVGTLKAQEGGSSLTYSRRYGIMSLLSLKSEDDDGNGGSGKGKVTEKKTKADKVKEKFNGEEVIDYKQKMKDLPLNVKDYLKMMKFSFDEVIEWCDQYRWEDSKMVEEINKL